MRDVTFARPAAFPAVCIACGQQSARSWKLKVKEGFNLILLRHERWLFLPVPLCKRCESRRFFGAFITPTAVLLGCVAGALATAARVADMISPSAQLFAIFAVLVWILVFINFGTRQVDYRILGVYGVAFSDDSVTLRFRGEPPAPILEMPRV